MNATSTTGIAQTPRLWRVLLSVLAVAGVLALAVGCAKPSAPAPTVAATPAGPLSTPAQPVAAPQPSAPLATNLPVEVTGLASQPVIPVPVAPPTLSQPAEELVQLAQARVGNDVLLAYIDSSNRPYNLKAPGIVYLTDLGVSAETIAAMVRRDQQLKAEAAAASAVADEERKTVEASQPVDSAEARPTEAAAVAAPEAASPPEPTREESGTTVTQSYFYGALAPYGTWIELPEYGWCWQPSVAVVEPGWRPYLNSGRWLWTDSGWYWQSYYSWGWAPFHYGRWHMSSSCGWVWAPDNCWGPAWVTWRYYPGYCGWAPLPPGCVYNAGWGYSYYGSRVSFTFGFGLAASCYAFVPTSSFYYARPWNYCASPTTVNSFYGQTTVINNVVQGNNNIIVNNGIGTETIAAASRTEIRKVRLSDTPSVNQGTTVQGERLSRDGATLAVYRPKLPTQASAPPSAVTQRQEQLKVRSTSLAGSDSVRSAAVAAHNRTITGRPLSTAGAARSPTASVPTPARSSAPAAVRPSSATADGPASSVSNVGSRPRVARTEAPRTTTRSSPPAQVQSNASAPAPSRVSPSRGTLPRPVTSSQRQDAPFASRAPEPRRNPVVVSPIRSSPTVPAGSGSPRSGSPSLTPTPISRSPVQRPESPRIQPPTSRSTPSTVPAPRPSAPAPRTENRRSAPSFAPSESAFRPAPAPAPSSSPRGSASAPAQSFQPAPAPRPSFAPAPNPSPSRPAPARSGGGASPSRSGGRTQTR
jgi:hypothetical protein